jgi:glutaredoxin 3
MARVVMYSTVVCPYCQMAERLLKQRGVEAIEKVLIDREPGKREEMMTRTGRRTVPQIYIDETTLAASTTCRRSTGRAASCRCWRPDADGGRRHARRSRSRDESDNAGTVNSPSASCTICAFVRHALSCPAALR